MRRIGYLETDLPMAKGPPAQKPADERCSAANPALKVSVKAGVIPSLLSLFRMSAESGSRRIRMLDLAAAVSHE